MIPSLQQRDLACVEQLGNLWCAATSGLMNRSHSNDVEERYLSTVVPVRPKSRSSQQP